MQKDISRQIKIILKNLQKTYGWYSGLPLKKYIQANIFSLKTSFNNPVINSGRWSAYCHYSQLTAFKNLISKHGINKNSTVFVHPLTPKNLVEYLESLEAKIITLDIDKSTLNCKPSSVLRLIKKESLIENVDLVIFYGFNGIYEEVFETIKELNEISVSSMFILDEELITPKALEIFETMDLGSVLYLGGESFLDNQLSSVLESPLAPNKWFYSWYLENRTQSNPEYHLSNSQPVYESILDAFFYLLSKQNKKQSIQNFFYGTFAGLVLLRNTFKTEQDAEKSIIEDYQNLPGSAVPDVFFELENTFSDYAFVNSRKKEYISKTDLIQEKTKEIYQILANLIEQDNDGDIEIPKIYLQRDYTNYFFYTSKPKKWKEILEKENLSIYKIHKISPKFKNDEKLENTKFASDYLMTINLFEAK